MLHYFCVIALLVAQASAQGRYFVGKFEGTYPWAYPIDMCVPSGVLQTPYVMFTCSPDGTEVTETVYKSTDTTCSQTVSKTVMYTEASMQGNGVYGFYCNGTNDYLATKLFVDSCTSPLATATVYSAINSCYKVVHTNYSVYDGFEDAQCNAAYATVSKYAYPEIYTTCDTSYALLVNSSNLTTTCAFYLSNPAGDVYAQMVDCVYNGYSQFPYTEDTSATYPKPEYFLQNINLTAELWPYSTLYADPELCSFDWFQFFSTNFDGSYVSVTSQCISNEGVDETYSGIWLDVEVYSDSNYYESCYNLTNYIYTALNSSKLFNFYATNANCSEANYTLPTPQPTMSPTMSSAGMQSISLIVIASSLLASMYIL